MKIEIITDIALEPITLEEVKEALKIYGTGHDTELERCISDARDYIEHAIDTSVLQREIKVTSDTELEEWELPLGPVSNLVESTDADDNYVYDYTGGEATCPARIKRLITDYIKYKYDIDDEAKELPMSIKKQIQLLTRQPGL
jgi:hypothetical protein